MSKCDGCAHLQGDDGAIFCTVKGDCITGRLFQPAPIQTNGDKIRQMTNEELATIMNGTDCCMCSYNNLSFDEGEKKSCIEGIKAWLNNPSEATS